VLGRDDVRLGQASFAEQPYGHLSPVLCGELPGGSGIATPTLRQPGRQHKLQLSARQPGAPHRELLGIRQDRPSRTRRETE
jgi:hypothetical protein